MEKLISKIEMEIEQLEEDIFNVHNNVSIGILERALEQRKAKLKELRNG